MINKSVYVVMKQRMSAVTIFEPDPDHVFSDKKNAEIYCLTKNQKAVSHLYWIRRVKGSL